MEKENTLARQDERGPVGRRIATLFERTRPARNTLALLVALYDELDPTEGRAASAGKVDDTVH
jgi:hypothetical protein